MVRSIDVQRDEMNHPIRSPFDSYRLSFDRCWMLLVIFVLNLYLLLHWDPVGTTSNTAARDSHQNPLRDPRRRTCFRGEGDVLGVVVSTDQLLQEALDEGTLMPSTRRTCQGGHCSEGHGDGATNSLVQPGSNHRRLKIYIVYSVQTRDCIAEILEDSQDLELICFLYDLRATRKTTWV